MRRVALTTIVMVMVCALVLVCFAATAVAKSAKPADQQFTATMSGVVKFGPGIAFVPPLPPSPSPIGLWTVSDVDGLIGTEPIHMFAWHPTPMGKDYGPGDMILTWGGDELYIRYWGYVDIKIPGSSAGSYEGPGSFMITGGTGRFENAYGGGKFTLTLAGC
jgi:hypothetical protein